MLCCTKTGNGVIGYASDSRGERNLHLSLVVRVPYSCIEDSYFQRMQTAALADERGVIVPFWKFNLIREQV